MLHPNDVLLSVNQNLLKKIQLMSYNKLPTRLIILCFMAMIGYSLAKSIKYESIVGFLMGLISLGAGIYVLYLLNKANQETNSEREESI